MKKFLLGLLSVTAFGFISCDSHGGTEETYDKSKVNKEYMESVLASMTELDNISDELESTIALLKAELNHLSASDAEKVESAINQLEAKKGLIDDKKSALQEKVEKQLADIESGVTDEISDDIFSDISDVVNDVADVTDIVGELDVEFSNPELTSKLDSLKEAAGDWTEDSADSLENNQNINNDQAPQVAVKKVSKITISDGESVIVAEYKYDAEGRLNTLDVTGGESKYSYFYNYDRVGRIQVEIGDDFEVFEKMVFRLDSKNRVVEVLEKGESSVIEIEYDQKSGYTQSIDFGNGVSYQFEYSNGMVTEWKYVNNNYGGGGADTLPIPSDWFAHKYPNGKINIDLNMQLFNAECAYPVPFMLNTGKFGDYLVERRMISFKVNDSVPTDRLATTDNPDYTFTETVEYSEVMATDDDWNVITYEFDSEGCPVKMTNQVSIQHYSKTCTYRAGDIEFRDEETGYTLYRIELVSESEPVKGKLTTRSEITTIEYLR